MAGLLRCGLPGLLGLGLVLVAGALAPAAAQTASAAVPFGHGRLWQVERDGSAPSPLAPSPQDRARKRSTRSVRRT